MDSQLTIRPMTKDDVKQIKIFADAVIGQNYYSEEELLAIFEKSRKNARVCSLVLATATGQIKGVRITYPPGKWEKGKGTGLRPELWQVSMDSVAYFQSLFVDPSIINQGWGKKLSLAAIEILRNMGALAIVTHSWKESPNDSSGKYLTSLGFKKVATHPHYWKNIDYICTRCGKPCLCTAEEMILHLLPLELDR